MKTIRGKKTALVLSGGVVKAATWHIGVAHALEELGFSFSNDNENLSDYNIRDDLNISTYVGSSAGTLVNVYLACGYSPTDIIDAFLNKKSAVLKPIGYPEMLKLNRNISLSSSGKTFSIFDSLPGPIRSILNPLVRFPGFFSTEGLKNYLESEILRTKSFDDFKPDLFAIATQLDHSRKVIFSKYNYPNPRHDSTATYYKNVSIADACAASMSVPPMYAPYPIFNKFTGQTDYYIDGEIRETLSTHVAEDNGCEVIISSWTHTPYHFQKEIGSLHNYGIPSIVLQALYLMIQKKIVASRARRNLAKDIIETVNDYLAKEKVSISLRKNITAILERKLNFNPDIQYIDIYPEHEDVETFFSNHFTLNPRTLSHVMKAGYKRTMEVFKQYDL